MRVGALSIVLVLAGALAGCVQVNVPTGPAVADLPADEPDRSPRADFSWTPEFPRVGAAIRFTPSVQLLRGTGVAEWDWSFGDGASSADAQPAHQYASPGERTVTLRLRTTDGQTAAVRHEVFVLGSDAAATTSDAATPDSQAGALPNETAAPLPEGVPADIRPEVLALRTAILAANGTRPVRVEASRVETLGGFGSWGAKAVHSVLLVPGRVLTNATWAEVDGEPVPRPFVEAYEGHVEGDPNALVRLTLAAQWARGSIRVGDVEHLIRINLDGNLPRGTRQAVLAELDGGAAWTPPRLVDGPAWTDDEACPTAGALGLSGWAPVTATSPVVELGRSGLAPLTADLILDGDARYLGLLGDDAFPMMVAMANEMDSIYDHELAIRHRIVGLHLNTDPDFYPDPGGFVDTGDGESPLGRLEAYWAGHHRDERDIVHLFTGYDAGYSQANCIGGAGAPAGVSFSCYPWEESVNYHTITIAHELGHLYAAHHHYGNHAEAELATIMIQGYTPGAQPVFGTLEKSVIRGWAEEMV